MPELGTPARSQPVEPLVVRGVVPGAEGHVVHPAPPLAHHRQGAPLFDAQLARGAGLAEPQHQVAAAAHLRLADGAEPEELGQYRHRRIRAAHRERDGTEPADRRLRLHATGRPRHRCRWKRRLVGGHQRQPLALGIAEVECRPAARLRDLVVLHDVFDQPLPPPAECARRHPEPDAGDVAHPGPVRHRARPVEEGDVGAGRALRVGIEEVVGGHVVLVHRLLHQAQAQHVAVEVQVDGRVAGDGGDVVQAEQGHGVVRCVTPEE